nr:hypothetical protein [Moritella viscosa]SHO15150.1 ATP-dependent helicase, putative [Moritella viscosa]
MKELKTLETLTKEINGKTFSFELDIKASLKVEAGLAVYNTVRKVIVGSSSKEVDFATFTINQKITNEQNLVTVKDLNSSFSVSDLKAVQQVALEAMGLHTAVEKLNANPLVLEFGRFYFPDCENYSTVRFEVDAREIGKDNKRYGAHGSFYIYDDGINRTYLKAYDEGKDRSWKPDLSFDLDKNDFVITNQDNVDYKSCRELMLFVEAIPDEAIRMIKDEEYCNTVFNNSKELKEILKAW